MRIGLLIDPFDTSLSYDGNLKKASDMGFSVLQLWYNDIISQGWQNPGRFIRMLGDLGLELKSIAAYTDLLDPKKPWREIFEWMKKVISYAAEAEVKFVVTESGGYPGGLESWDELLSRLSQLIDHGKLHGVTILIENGPGVLINNKELMIRLMKTLNSEYLGINFDPANLNLVPDDVIGAVKSLGSFIRDTHAKDSILFTAGSTRRIPEEHVFVMPEGEEFIHVPKGGKWVLPPVGEGDVPFEEYIYALKEVGFSGDLIIEYQGGGDREGAIIQSKNYLERILMGK
ncbi:MAG: sugar phosphate isomerase/epimerase family protein [Spirochaetota bacterium]